MQHYNLRKSYCFIVIGLLLCSPMACDSEGRPQPMSPPPLGPKPWQAAHLPSKDKPLILATTGSFSPPHTGHIKHLCVYGAYLEKMGYTVNKHMLIISSYQYYLRTKHYADAGRPKFSDDDRIALGRDVAAKMRVANTISVDCANHLEISNFEVDLSNTKGRFVDYPEVYSELQLANPNVHAVYVHGDDLPRAGVTYDIVSPKKADVMSSTSLMRGTKAAIDKLEREAPGYFGVLKNKAASAPYNYAIPVPAL